MTECQSCRHAPHGSGECQERAPGRRRRRCGCLYNMRAVPAGEDGTNRRDGRGRCRGMEDGGEYDRERSRIQAHGG